MTLSTLTGRLTGRADTLVRTRHVVRLRRARLGWALLLLVPALGAQEPASFDQPLVARGALGPEVLDVLRGVPLAGVTQRRFPEAAPLPDGRLGLALLPAPVQVAADSSPALVLLHLQTEPDAAARAALLAAASEATLAQMVAQAPLDRPRHPDIVPGDSARNARVLDELLDELITRRGQAYYSELLTGFAARLRVADWLRRRGDRKCVGVYEELLVEWGRRPGWCEPLYRLGLWYSEQGDPDEAVATWARGDEYSTDHGAHFLIFAANEWRRRDPAQAAVLYARAYDASATQGDGWSMALALRGQADARQRAGDLAGALATLERPVTGPRADEGRAALAARRASLLFEARDYVAAELAATTALARLAEVAAPTPGDGFESLRAATQRCAEWAARWASASAWAPAAGVELARVTDGEWAGQVAVYVPAGEVPQWAADAGLTVTEDREARGPVTRFHRKYVLDVRTSSPLAGSAVVRVWSGGAEMPLAPVRLMVAAANEAEVPHEVESSNDVDRDGRGPGARLPYLGDTDQRVDQRTRL